MISVLLISTALFLAVQENSSEPQEELSGVEYFYKLQQADRLFQSQDYVAALDIYERLSESDPQNGRLFERIANCHAGLGNRNQAAQATLRMARLGHGRHAVSYYGIARNHARNGEVEQANAWIEKALAARWWKRSAIQQDLAFRSMRADPHFGGLAGVLPKREFTREEGWRHDIELFASEVARLGADPDRYGVSEEFLNEVKDLKRRVAELSNEHIALEIQKLAASLGNGHSNVYPQPTKRVRFTMLPIQLYLFSDGMFVVGGQGEAAELVGHKVLEIGSKSPSTLLEQMKSIIHRDNDMGILWLGPQFLGIPEVLEFCGAIESPDEVPFKLQDHEGNVQTVVLPAGPMERPKRLGPAGPKDQAPLYLQDVPNNYWLQNLSTSNTIYFQFNQVRDKQDSESISAFADTLRQAIIDSRPRNLIVDLRHNNGGTAYLYLPLVRPLVFFEMLDKRNRLYIITGRNTFSAAQNFLNAIEPLTNAIIVGEPSSGRPNTVGAESEVVLPWSGLRVSIAYLFFQDSIPTDLRPWVPPHVPVKLTSSDYFSHRDPAMEAIEQIIRASNQ